MSPDQALTSIAEIAIALAGFTGLVAAFRQRTGEWTYEERYRIRLLLVLTFDIVGCALLPFAISGVTSDPNLIWGIPLIGFGAVGLGIIADTIRQIVLKKVEFAFRNVIRANLVIAFVLLPAMMLNGFGLVYSPSPALLVLGFIWALILGGTVFLAMLTLLWSSAASPRD